MKTFLVIITLALSLCADDSYLGGVGGNIFGEEQSESIQMVREIVWINLTKSGGHVKCKFWFYNKDTIVHNVSVGFPNFKFSPSGGTDSLTNFICKVNGKLENEIGKTKCATFYSDTNALVEKDWFTWNVEFKNNDTTIIENEYNGKWGGTICERAFVYTIGTGSTWNGPIGEARIVFYHQNLASKNFVITDSIWAHRKPMYFDDSTVYEFNNYKPRRNEEVEIWFHSYWDFGDKRVKDIKCPGFYGHVKSAEQARLMRNEIFARHGYIFKDLELSKYFKKTSWYKENAKFNESMLSKKELEFINNLTELEVKLKSTNKN
jgi:hypothetical protein